MDKNQASNEPSAEKPSKPEAKDPQLSSEYSSEEYLEDSQSEQMQLYDHLMKKQFEELERDEKFKEYCL